MASSAPLPSPSSGGLTPAQGARPPSGRTVPFTMPTAEDQEEVRAAFQGTVSQFLVAAGYGAISASQARSSAEVMKWYRGFPADFFGAVSHSSNIAAMANLALLGSPQSGLSLSLQWHYMSITDIISILQSAANRFQGIICTDLRDYYPALGPAACTPFSRLFFRIIRDVLLTSQFRAHNMAVPPMSCRTITWTEAFWEAAQTQSPGVFGTARRPTAGTYATPTPATPPPPIDRLARRVSFTADQEPTGGSPTAPETSRGTAGPSAASQTGHRRLRSRQRLATETARSEAPTEDAPRAGDASPTDSRGVGLLGDKVPLPGDTVLSSASSSSSSSSSSTSDSDTSASSSHSHQRRRRRHKKSKSKHHKRRRNSASSALVGAVTTARPAHNSYLNPLHQVVMARFVSTRPMLSGIDCIDALRQGLDLLASAAAPRAAFHELIYDISVHFKAAKTAEERAHSGVADGLIQSLKDEIVETLGALEGTTTVDRTLQLLTCIKDVFRQGDPPTYKLAKTKLKKLKAHSKLQGAAATFVKNVGGGDPAALTTLQKQTFNDMVARAKVELGSSPGDSHLPHKGNPIRQGVKDPRSPASTAMKTARGLIAARFPKANGKQILSATLDIVKKRCLTCKADMAGNKCATPGCKMDTVAHEFRTAITELKSV